MPYCPNCGTEVTRYSTFCPNCGESLGTDAEAGPGESAAAGSGAAEVGQPGVADNAANDPATAGENSTRHSQGQQGSSRAAQPADGPSLADGKLSYAINHPIADGYEPLIFGSACYAGSSFLLPLFPLFGYIYRLMRGAANGNRTPPPLEEYVEMTKEGLLLFALYVLLLVLWIGAVAGITYAAYLEATTEVAALVAIVGLFVGGYLVPASLVIYGVTGSVTAALSPGRVTEFAFSMPYLGAYLLYIALMLVFQIAFLLGIILLAITVVGLFLLLPLSFVAPTYLLYASAVYWGATYRQALQKGIVGARGDETVDESPGDRYATDGGRPEK
jgi:hypothetical protein